jgi:hypothetical protein
MFTQKSHNSQKSPFIRYAHLKRPCQQHFGLREAAMADPQPGPSLTRQIDVFMPLSREAKATTEKSGGVKDDQCLKSACHCHVRQTLNTHERKDSNSHNFAQSCIAYR